jgi:hypothetical protein
MLVGVLGKDRKKTYHETLEAKLLLENTIHELTILAAVRVVDSLVRAHDTRSPHFQRVHEGPSIQLVQRTIVYIRRNGFAFITRSSSVLLFLSKPMLIFPSVLLNTTISLRNAYLWRSDNTLLLRPLRDHRASDTRKIRVRSQTFPIPSTSYNSSNGPNKRPKSNVNALALVLFS